jgi:MFS transporter, DHA1 family, multidrug resistance protein
MGVHVPAMEQIAAGLGETVLHAQLSVPAFVVAFGLSMIGAGALVDRAGVRLASTVGLMAFIVGAVLAGAAVGLPSLLIGRILMGVGAAFAIVVPRVAVASNLAHVTSDLARLSAIQSAVPALAPLLGAGIATSIGWRATFWLPAAIASALLVATTLMLPKHQHAAERGRRDARPAPGWIRRRAWLLPTAEIALVTAIFLVLLAQTSNLLAHPFELGTAEVGFVLALTGVAFVTGSVVLVRTRDAIRLQRASRVVLVVAMALLIVGEASVVVWTIGLMLYALTNGVLVPAGFGAIARAVSVSKGQALGATGAIQMLLGAAAGAAANAFGGLTPMTFGVCGFVAAVAILLLASFSVRLDN